MSVPYKNPISSIQVGGPQSISRTSVFGTNFSVNSIGGYMEVYNLSDLTLTLTASTYPDLIQLSANTIPIRYTKGNGTFSSPDYITLNSDNVSSGRRKLGMLVYVHETDLTYQFVIPNYDTLWNNLTGLTGFSAITYSDYTTVVTNHSSAGQSFIQSWTASTIEGVGGYTSANANWRIFQTGSSSGGTTSGAYLPLSGGTVTGPTNFTNGLSANTISATTYYNLPPSTFSGGTVTGPTIFTNGLTANTISATTYYNLSSNFQYEIHVSQVDGNDATGNGTLLNPVKTIVNALTLVGSQRKTIIIHPGTYTENPNITVQYTVLTSFELLGGNTVISGTVSTSSGCTISGLKMTNLNISASTGTGNVNVLNCDISGTLTKSNTGDYTVIRFCDIGTTNITSSGGLVAIFGGNPNFITINNVGARVIVKNAVTVAPVLTSGNANFVDSILISTGLTSNAITTSVGTIVTLANSQIIVPTFNNVARVSLSGLYSIFNCVYDKPNSTLVSPSGPTLTSGSTNSIDYFQYINADKFITQGGTSSKYVMGDGSLSNGFTGGTVSGDTIFTSGLTANTISATTYQNLPATPFLPLSGGTVSGATNFTGGLTANTISATTYQNLPTDIFVTGGTYTSGNAIFTNNSGGTFTVSGFPIGSGGGQIFYLNLSQSQNGNRFLSTTASTASEQSTGVTISNGVTSTIASFQSQPLNTTILPGGIWSFYLHSYKENSNASFNIFVELYKITSGGTQTLLFTTDPISVTTNSPNPSMQLTDGYFSGTPLSVSDSVVAVVRATNTNNQPHTITLFTEGSQHYSYVVSTIPTQQGLTCDTLSGCSIIQTIQTDVSNKLDKSGGTITGNLIVNSNLTATTISATTYQNLPATPFLPLSGGTVTGATSFTNGLTATTVSATTYQNLPTDVRVTGATYSNNTFTYTNNTGGTFSVFFNTMTGLTATTISATTYQNLPTDIRVTGGTYSSGSLTFTNNTGGTFNVTGLYTGGTDVYVTGGTFNKGTSILTFTNVTGGTFNVTGLTDIFVTGGTYSGSTIIFTNNTGGTFNVTGITTSSSFTGGTVSGATNFTGGLTANTISATTITSPSVKTYGLIVATSLGYQNIF